ncbi:MAG: hypothetical protein DRQ13_09305, partial [Ignavibacteriae bacterium]
MAADGNWDWELVDSIQMPTGWPEWMPLIDREDINRNGGKSDRDRALVYWRGAWWDKWHDIDPLDKDWWLSRDIMGDDDDPWNIDDNELFTPWSSPSSYYSGDTDISIRLYSQN